MFCFWTLSRSKKFAPFQIGAVIFWTNFHLERSFLPFLRIVHVQNRIVDKLILMLCSWTYYRSKNFASFRERSVFKRFVQLYIPAHKEPIVKELQRSVYSVFQGSSIGHRKTSDHQLVEEALLRRTEMLNVMLKCFHPLKAETSRAAAESIYTEFIKLAMEIGLFTWEMASSAADRWVTRRGRSFRGDRLSSKSVMRVETSSRRVLASVGECTASKWPVYGVIRRSSSARRYSTFFNCPVRYNVFVRAPRYDVL